MFSGALIVSSESNNNKPIRSQQRHVKLANTGGIKGRSSASSGRSPASIDLENGRGSAKTTTRFNAKLAATAVKDEVIDIFESIAFATSAKERFENTFDAIKRHKFLLSAGAVALVLKSTVGGKVSVKIPIPLLARSYTSDIPSIPHDIQLRQFRAKPDVSLWCASTFIVTL